ncbi:MAG TPA: molecular chaperone HtpG, partial [Gammaproteobacteria bacterium]|nr:molecular chaperone HtpG [Gammaproteobacteria bacterium]
VVLHLKPDEDEFLNDWRLKHIIMKYSDHLTLPVLIKNEKNEDEVVNRATALWTLSKSEITDEQYKELYKHVSHDFQDPLVWTHNKVEGKLEYVTLLYIPEHAPFDLWHVGKTRGLKLYVRRVFIMDDAEQFLPHYLRFVRGIIDSNDLPLNISREILQSNRIIDTIKTAVIKRVLGMLEQLATDDKPKYQIFWNAFGQVLKEGPAEDFSNKEQIAKLLRFASTHSENADQTVSLEDYIARMPAGQTKIFYVTADTFNAASHSPHLEIFRKKGIEVLLLTDRVDEWLMTHLTEFQGKPVQAVTRGGLDLGDLADKTAEEHHKQAETDFEETVKKVKELLQSSVKDVRLSQRLTDSPACIVLDEQDMSGQMERMLRASGQQVPTQKPILELNPDHRMIKHLKDEQDSARFEDWSRILLDQAILAEGGQLEDPASFVQRFNKLLLALTER